MVLFSEFRRWLSARKATTPSGSWAINDGVVGHAPVKDTHPTYVYDVFIRGQLKYQFMESIWYDTASPAQGCIARLLEIKKELPGVVIRGFGKEYKIDTSEELKRWAKDVFSPTGCDYVCDFSQYL